MQPVPTDRRSSARSESAGRRTRLRLRELCDEVLASYRVATGRDPLTSTDREAAGSLLRRVAPGIGRGR